jgi:ubiquinone/menaquinone biosynthesis C-methylase UbiE
MDDLQKSVIESLDGSANTELYPYLPYILQDLWEMGTDPKTVVELVEKHISRRPLNIVDLGCGKGAVSIRLAEAFDCMVLGIDGLPEFIDEARKFAENHVVAHKCQFRAGDARLLIHELKGYDIAILGAVGQIFGDIHQTLTTVGKALNPGGYIIIDDGWITDESTSDDNRYLRKSAFYGQIAKSGFEIIEENIFKQEFIDGANDAIFAMIKKRALELIEKEPGNRAIFEYYIEAQQHENQMMATELVCALWILKKRNESNLQGFENLEGF